MQLFYFENITLDTTVLHLDKEQARHMTKALRKKVGDTVHITDGAGNLFNGTISLVTSSKCNIDLAFAKAYPQQSPRLHVAIAPTKMNDRMEWFLEKATEMGIASITPLLCDHSERKKINLERFKKIIVSAMQQSNQFYLPQIKELTVFNQFLENPVMGVKCIAHCEETDKKLLTHIINREQDLTIIIGPEGDLSSREIEAAINTGFSPVSLGTKRLRTETAGVYAAAVFNSFIEQ
ncbi:MULTISPECIES: 16S rRNA (uracil(1498)-N(3))-methyltransferase [Nonlabens]|uniref:Ribosomal RNA small subunit methyltransferase E n=1 Tax=Nonlabens xylanidelens TaxID=191564 RepID=A0A2S6IKW8_9FLAO|nr:16S rRNA (uracil(1498)-N(3))-methyltransferase [Nonlabens xylanidelens]PPK94859.1 16S rRNA (uracil1498-N3)-methyltransferase [Nonlabens xylanidelens]PQJ17409.1 16S rRNA (uracil(1498)-N(3))-methyltransferase [Nonlabens xylanidelens]